MNYMKMVNGENIPMSDDEIAARQDEERQFEERRQVEQWKADIAATDRKLPRYAEDIIDALDEVSRVKLASQTLSAYQEKKTLRSHKPQGA